MRHYFKPFLIVLGLLLFTFGCQKDDSLILEEEAQIESLKAFNITSREIPTHIFNFLKTKTNNNFGVSIIKNKIKLSSTSINEFSRDTPLGIVQTNKVVQVYNERNTKYTFNVSSPTNADSVINLVVVDMGGDIIEYFIEYIFDPNNPVPMLPSGGIDMRNFTGAMIFYNFNGETIGNYILIDGTLVTFEGRTTPCDDDEDIDYNESDNENGGGTNGSTAQNDPSDPNHNGNDNNGENLGPSGEGEFVDTDYVSPCISISYQPCCDGLANGHGVEECGCGSGSPTTISDSCTGSSITFTNARNATSREGGNTENTSSPCDGDTGVIIEIDDILLKKLAIENCLQDDYDATWFDSNPESVSGIAAYLDGNCTNESKTLVLEFEEIKEKIPNAIFERYEELLNIIAEDPWALIQDCSEQNGLDTSNYIELYELPFPEACSNRLNNSVGVGPHQPITDGNVPLANIDYYSVEITEYPDFNEDGSPDSEAEMYQVFRNNFTNLASGEKDDFQFGCDVNFDTLVDWNDIGDISWEFIPVTNQDGIDFVSNNPIASILLIEADASGMGTLAADDGAVIVSDFTDNDFTISTIFTDNNGTQPFSGNRQWGWFINQNGNFEFFTRAVDVANISILVSLLTPADNECQQDTYYNVGEATWGNMQEEIMQWVNDYGGQSNIVPGTAVRVDKEKIRELLTSNQTINEINCD